VGICGRWWVFAEGSEWVHAERSGYFAKGFGCFAKGSGCFAKGSGYFVEGSEYSRKEVGRGWVAVEGSG
jgi:hypothetical protein